jgi:hypothetical protein
VWASFQGMLLREYALLMEANLPLLSREIALLIVSDSRSNQYLLKEDCDKPWKRHPTKTPPC